MENLEVVDETIKKTEKTKKELEDSIINDERNENKDIDEKASKVEICKIWLAY